MLQNNNIMPVGCKTLQWTDSHSTTVSSKPKKSIPKSCTSSHWHISDD